MSAVCDNPCVSEIDVVRGRLDSGTRSALERHGAAPGDVVCVLRDGNGAPTGAAAVRDTPFPGVADRRLWRLELLGAAPERFRDLHAATWCALDAEYRGSGPEGLLATPAEPDVALEWADPRTILAGYTEEGREARIAYFSTARTVPLPDWPPADPPYRVLAFAEQDEVTRDDVVAMWRREGVLSEPEAWRRADEILLVAVDRDGAPAGVSTAYLRRNEQVRLDLWHVRAFVAAAHRRGSAATALAVRACEHLEAAFVSGRDRRAPGLLFEVENPALKQVFHAAVWHETNVAFIGENARGDHVRVRYFAGATRSVR